MRPLIGTSWKMHLSASEAGRYLEVLRPLVAGLAGCDVFVLPPFTAIWVARDRLAGSAIAWGAQDVHGEDDGAHTGDVSAAMLADLGCTYVEVGHSERRRDHGETDDVVAAQGRAGRAPRHDADPVRRRAGARGRRRGRGSRPRPARAVPGVRRRGSLAGRRRGLRAGLGDRRGRPGGRPDHIGAVQRAIRTLVRDATGGAGGRVIYGGSVDESSAAAILATDGVDGLFVGRAALDPVRFAAIVGIAARTAGG